MSRADALRSLARSDPDAYLQAALDCGVLEAAGALDQPGSGLQPQWWPEMGSNRRPVFAPGPALRAQRPPPARPDKGEGSDCPTRKVQYTKAGAREERDRWRASGDSTAKDYRCLQCGSYHVGHTRRADKKAAMGGR